MYRKCLLILIILFYPVICFAGFGTDMRVNDDSTQNDQHIGAEKTAVVLKGTTVYTVWQDNRNFSDEYEEFLKSDIYFSTASVSSDGSVALNSNVLVNDYSGGPWRDDSSAPSMAVADDGTIYIVWTDNRNVDNQLEGNDIYLSRSTDGGKSFLTDQLISSTQGFSAHASVAVSGSDVYVVYRHCCQPANNVLNFVRSTDGGQSFSGPQTIYIPTEGYAGADCPVVTAEGEHVYVAFKYKGADSTGDVSLLVSSDKGQTFSSSVKINDDNLETSTQTEISIACAGSNVYIVWRDRRDDAMGIYLAVSKDYASTFGKNQLVLPLETDPANRPVVSAYGEMLAITYEGTMEGHYGQLVFARLSSDMGSTWSERMVVTSTEFNRPGVGPSSVSISEDACCVFWVDDAQSDGTGDDVYLDCYYFGGDEEAEGGDTDTNCGDANGDGKVDFDDVSYMFDEFTTWLTECWKPNFHK